MPYGVGVRVSPSVPQKKTMKTLKFKTPNESFENLLKKNIPFPTKAKVISNKKIYQIELICFPDLFTNIVAGSIDTIKVNIFENGIEIKYKTLNGEVKIIFDKK